MIYSYHKKLHVDTRSRCLERNIEGYCPQTTELTISIYWNLMIFRVIYNKLVNQILPISIQLTAFDHCIKSYSVIYVSSVKLKLWIANNNSLWLQDSRLKTQDTLFVRWKLTRKQVTIIIYMFYDYNGPGGTRRHIVSLESSHLGLRGNPAFEISPWWVNTLRVNALTWK